MYSPDFLASTLCLILAYWKILTIGARETDSSVFRVHSLQAWPLESNPWHSCKKSGIAVCISVTPILGNRNRWLATAHEPDNLAEIVSFYFSGRPCFKAESWIIIEEAIQCLALASACIHPCLHTHNLICICHMHKGKKHCSNTSLHHSCFDHIILQPRLAWNYCFSFPSSGIAYVNCCTQQSLLFQKHTCVLVLFRTWCERM